MRGSSKLHLGLPLVLLGAILAGMGWGLWRLAGIFQAERDEALRAIEDRRTGLAHHAGVALERSLNDRVERTKGAITRAANDPLFTSAGLYLQRDGQQVLPRIARFRDGAGTPARALFEALRGGMPAPRQRDDAVGWRARLSLRAAFLRALDDRDQGAVTASFRALLGHRARHVISPARDIPTALATLAIFLDRGSPAPELLRDLLRDGLEDPRGLRIPGLMRSVLRETAAFTATDHAFLAARLVEICERAGVGHAAFSARLSEFGPEVPVPAEWDEPLLVQGARWFVRPTSEGEARGVRVDLRAAVSEVAAEMRRLGVLRADEAFTAPSVGLEPVSVRGLRPRVRSPHIDTARPRARAAWTLKTGLLGATGLLASLLIVLSLLELRRRRHFVNLKSDFVATVSHELRTPLASIRVLAETLERRLDGHPVGRDYPTRIVRDIDGLTFLVENILSFNRLDRGRFTLHPTPVNLTAAVASVRAELDRIETKTIEWRTGGAPEVVVQADADLLHLLLLNVARNACQHNERDPIRLEISVSVAPRRVHLDLSDNGVGVAPAARRHLFTAFWRAPGSRSRGSGLGLAICQRIATLHDGDLSLLHTGEEGSTFRLTLPRTSGRPERRE